MPNWKKVIVSGSDAVLNSLNVTNGVTGSLFGTGSWAVRAQSASIADNAVTASRALQANTASYAVFAATATSATSAGSATSASYATFAATSTTSTNATNATSASYATFANTASSANDFIVRGSAAIGTTSVGAAKLEVVGNIRTSTYYNFNGNPSVPTDTTAAIFDQSGVGPTISGLNITFRAGSPTPSEIMRVSSGGSVGINNTNPTYKLDVSDAGSVLSSTVSTGSMKGIRIYNTTTATSNNAIGLWFATGPHQAGIASFRATADTTWETTLAFYTHVDATSNLNDATEKMRITGQGNVGIGTTIPVNKLTVAGNADFGASTSTYAGPAQYGALTFPRGQILWSNTNGQNQLYLASNAYNNASGVFAYRSGSKATAIGLDDGGMSFLTAGNGTANATISWTTAMVIANGGNIGIGTTLPNYRLTVGNSNGSAAVHIGGGNSNSIPAIAIQSDFSSWASSQNGFAYYYNATNGNLDLYRKDNSTTENQVMSWTRATGNVGIGTLTPNYPLVVYRGGASVDTIVMDGSTGYNVGLGIYKGSAQRWAVYSSNIDTFHIYNTGLNRNVLSILSGSGFVGINSSTPVARLDLGSYDGKALKLQPSSSGGQVWMQFESKANAGSDMGFILLQDDSAQVQGAPTAEDVRFTMGVFNDFAGTGTHSDELWMQGGARLVYNVGSWDTELNSIIGAPSAKSAGDLYSWNKNNSQVMVMNIDGNVGINSTSPSYKLTVNGDAFFQSANVKLIGGTNYNENIRMYPGSNDYSSLVFGAVSGDSGTGNGQWSLIRYPSTSNYQYAIRYNATDVMTFTTSSGVGFSRVAASNEQIAISVPNGQYAIAFYTGSTLSFGLHTNNNVFNFNSVNGSAWNFQNGNVGIGNTNPSQKLEVAGVIRGEALNPYGSTNIASTSPYLYSPSLGALGIGGNGSERVRIDANGNVGIGTSTNSAPLEIYRNGSEADVTGGGVLLTRYNTGTSFRGSAIFHRYISSGSSGDSMLFTVSDSSNPYISSSQALDSRVKMVINAVGNVGIGTYNSGYKLDVWGGPGDVVRFKSTNSSESLRAYLGSGYKIFQTSDNDQFGYFGTQFLFKI